MLYRKISTDIEAHLRSGSDKIMVVEGARQIGKSYIIREVGNRLYKNFVEINFAKDDEGRANSNSKWETLVYYIMCIERSEIPEGDCTF